MPTVECSRRQRVRTSRFSLAAWPPSIASEAEARTSFGVHLLTLVLAGWLNRHHQRLAIECLREENGVLREMLGTRRLRFTDAQPAPARHPREGARAPAACLDRARPRHPLHALRDRPRHPRRRDR